MLRRYNNNSLCLVICLLSACLIEYGQAIVFSKVHPKNRVDCAPRPSDNEDDCRARGCFWDGEYDKLDTNVPFCYFPPESGFHVDLMGIANLLVLKRCEECAKNPYGEQFKQVPLSYKRIGKSTLKVSIGHNDRYQVPLPVNETPEKSGWSADTDEKLVFKYTNDSVFSFNIQRKSDAVKIWDTSIGGMMFADQFIQIATYLSSDRIYGFGEHIHQSLKHDFSTYHTWGMHARDQPTDSQSAGNSKNYYGVHPFYLGVEPSGKAHGVFFLNSNAQDFTTGPAPHLVYRTTGGRLDLYFFAGPTPTDVIRQYHQLIGRPYLPPWWSLGFQLCRYGYEGTQEIRDTVKRTQDAGIPFDIIYSDIDYMDRYKDFTVSKDEKWKGFRELIDKFHEENLHLILIFDPAIQADHDSFKRALESNAKFIEWPRDELVPHHIQDQYPLAKDTRVMLGVVWPDRHVGFPDFLDHTNATTRWWTDETVRFHRKIPFDGMWIDMNEPSNFQTDNDDPHYPGDHPVLEALHCPRSGDDAKWESPAYLTKSAYCRNSKTLHEETLCMVGTSGRGKYTQYDVHSLYGWSEHVASAVAVHAAVGKRAPVVSRSTFAGSGVHGGHWLGDNTATFHDLRTSIIGIQEFNMFGIPYVGADVCGFIGATTEELCLRWQQLGAWSPFYRNHNDNNSPPQDPALWESVANATREANLYRYRILPYYYSLHFRASLYGGMVVQPLFFEFPNDFVAQTLSDQLMIGPALVVVPVTAANVSSVRGYLPRSADWYSATNAHGYGVPVSSGYSQFHAPKNTSLPAFIRAGSIIPRQRPSMTTVETRCNEFEVLAALTRDDEVRTATGELFWDDGESLFNDIASHHFFHFNYTIKVDSERTTLVIRCDRGYDDPNKIQLPTLDTIEAFGYAYRPKLSTAQLNGRPLHIDQRRCTYSVAKQLLRINTPNLIDLNERDGPTWTITWQNSKHRILEVKN